MGQATTSAPESTTRPDLEANAKLFARHLRAANRSPATIRSYLDALRHLDDYLAARGMPRDVATIRREHVEAFIEDQLARLKPASAANRYRSLQQLFPAEAAIRRLIASRPPQRPPFPCW